MIFFFHDWEFPPKLAPSVYYQGMDGKPGCLKGDSTGSISCSADWFISWNHQGEGGSGSLLATHLPTVYWCYVAHGVAGPNMVWVVNGLVDRSCGIGWIAVSSRPHSTGHFCPVVQLPAGPRRPGLFHRRQLHPEARFSAASWLLTVKKPFTGYSVGRNK